MNHKSLTQVFHLGDGTTISHSIALDACNSADSITKDRLIVWLCCIGSGLQDLERSSVEFIWSCQSLRRITGKLPQLLLSSAYWYIYVQIFDSSIICISAHICILSLLPFVSQSSCVACIKVRETRMH